MAETIRILIADDQPRARGSVKALLSTWSRVAEIREAGNGREAVQLAEEFRPDVVLMDVRMPEIDGLEATMQIKARWPRVKVIVLSMYIEYRNQALAAGADAFVAKGDAWEELFTTLEGIVKEG
jgi:DNA-binding NarL/FixJ family response regulator